VSSGWGKTVLGAVVALALCTPAQAGPHSEKGRGGGIGRAHLDAALRSHQSFDGTTTVIVTVRDGADEDVKKRVEGHGSKNKIVNRHRSINAMSVRVDQDGLATLANDPDVESVSIDADVTASATIDDGSSVVSDLKKKLALGNWFTGSTVTIAVIDSGIAPTADSSGRIIGTFDFTGGKNGGAVAASDEYGHGTHVAGLAGASGAVSAGAFGGVVPGVKLLALKVLDKKGAGKTSDVIAAVDFAVANRANNAVVHERDGRWGVHGDPTEGALLVAAGKAGVESAALDERLPRVGELPFSSERKLMSTLHRDTGRDRGLVLTKGAPDVLLARCSQELVGDGTRPLTPERRAEILAVNEELAGEALRTLGVAARPLTPDALAEHTARPDERLEQDLAFIALIGIIDPPRPEARAAVAKARRAGIRPLMITGDHPRTASVIARELGIATDGRTLTGADFDALAPDAARRAIAEVSVYARVNPEHKLRIVDALRRDGAVVAMTGDGVNDAPALKKADIGIAMGITGTDVSKEAADMVLADDDFATIVAAVEEGRAIFANIRKFLRYLLSSNIGEVLTMFFGVVLAERIGLYPEEGAVVLPLLATQILWINLVTDGPPALALGVDPADEGLMRQPPRPAGEGVVTPQMWRGIALIGVVMAVATLYVLDASMPGGFVSGVGDLRYGQTMAFTTLMLLQIFNVLNARSDERSAFVHLFTNQWLWIAMSGSVALQVLVVHAPFLQRAFGTVGLSAGDWLFCTAVASSVLWVREITKVAGRRR